MDALRSSVVWVDGGGFALMEYSAAAPLKRTLEPLGDVDMVTAAVEAYGKTPVPEVVSVSEVGVCWRQGRGRLCMCIMA